MLKIIATILHIFLLIVVKKYSEMNMKQSTIFVLTFYNVINSMIKNNNIHDLFNECLYITIIE